MFKKLAVLCLFVSCALGMTVISGCSGGPAEVEVDMAKKDLKLGTGKGPSYSEHEGAMKVD